MYRSRARLALFLLGLVVCGFECDLPKTKQIASVAGRTGSEKIENRTMESLYAGIVQLLKSRGFKQGRPASQPGYSIPAGRFYSDGFWHEPHIGCSVIIRRRAVTVDFYESEWPLHSGNFPTTSEQRDFIRVAATDVETYLRNRLPDSYELHVSM